jgi:plastocyanin
VNFQTQPFSFHIVTLAADEEAARKAYPIVALRPHDPAVGTGLPKISFGDGAFPVTGGSVHGGGIVSKDKGKGPPACGAVQFGQPPCTFAGGDAVEVIGPTVGWDLEQRPATIDQHVIIDAPAGEYAYFDMLHPGMRGTLTVVPDDQPVTSQAEVDEASARQFHEARIEAMALESFLNRLDLTRGAPGDRDIVVFNGASTGRVLINAMLPNRTITAVPGDRIHFVWADHQSIHTIGFAPAADALPSPFGYDCGPEGFQPVPNTFNAPPPNPCTGEGYRDPEPLCDPGNAAPGSPLGGLDEVVNSGLLIGSAFGLSPVAGSWSVTVTDATAKGSHPFFDAVHPWMTGVVEVG